jgi:crotonobetainyl-CoA:carnitine CoA-transferase CaiB-like acyl-CoA transferase
VLTCLNEAQRRAALGVLGLADPWAADPQAPPADAGEHDARAGLVARFEALLAEAPAAEWIAAFRAAGVPAAEVRPLERLYDDPQVRANGLVQDVAAPAAGAVRLLGNVFKVDGRPAAARRGVPALGEHTAEVLGELA